MLTALLILTGLIILLVGYELVRLFGHINKGIALGKITTKFERILPSATETILIIGDSTSYGTGTTLPEASLAGRLAAHFPGTSVVNHSKNAMSLAELGEKLALIEEPFTRTFIHVGGVDTLMFTPLSRVREQTRAAIQKAKSFTKGPLVFVSVNNPTVTPAYRFPLAQIFNARSRQVSLACGEVCEEEGVLHVPLWAERESDPLTNSPHLIASDGLHPSNDGYALWFEKIKKVF